MFSLKGVDVGNTTSSMSSAFMDSLHSVVDFIPRPLLIIFIGIIIFMFVWQFLKDTGVI